LTKQTARRYRTIDASKPSTTVKERKNQTLLSPQEEDYIIDTFNCSTKPQTSGGGLPTISRQNYL
jgi:hypothetical protein